MIIRIENIGKVRHADVKLNGITVVAGENSSGKSTVGKILFSSVKAVADAREDDDKNREKPSTSWSLHYICALKALPIGLATRKLTNYSLFRTDSLQKH